MNDRQTWNRLLSCKLSPLLSTLKSLVRHLASRRLVALSLLFTLVACQYTKDENPIVASAGSSWELVWNDEFNDESLDRSKWNVEVTCWGGGNRESQCYTDRNKNIALEDGKLRITAHKETFEGPADSPFSRIYDETIKTTLPYTSARLNTHDKADWKYGRIEFRAKLPSGQGTWPAIWMLPSDWVYGGWPVSGEIDILEAVNLKTPSDKADAPEGEIEDRIYGTLHFGRAFPQNEHQGATYNFDEDNHPSDHFQNYAFEWEEGEMRWYVNGEHYATQTQDGWYSQKKKDNGNYKTNPGDAPFNQNFHLLINFAVGGNWPVAKNETGIDESVFPQTLEVDYIRVFQCSKDKATGKGCATRSVSATMVKGVETPSEENSMTSFGKGQKIEMLTSALHPLITVATHNPKLTISHSVLSDFADKQKNLHVVQNGNVGNVEFHLPDLVDLRQWIDKGVLKFDLKVIESDENTKLTIRIDSLYPDSSAMNIKAIKTEGWQTFSIPIETLSKLSPEGFPGKTANFDQIERIFVVETSSPVEFYMRNIRWER